MSHISYSCICGISQSSTEDECLRVQSSCLELSLTVAFLSSLYVPPAMRGGATCWYCTPGCITGRIWKTFIGLVSIPTSNELVWWCIIGENLTAGGEKKKRKEKKPCWFVTRHVIHLLCVGKSAISAPTAGCFSCSWSYIMKNSVSSVYISFPVFLY